MSSNHVIEGLRLLINNNPVIVGYIVNMIRLDYFDEAIGITEGFTIFEELLRCGKINLLSRMVEYLCISIDELKRQILGYDITTLLEHKLGAGRPREMRTSLVYLNIFRIRAFYIPLFLVDVTKPV